MIRKFALIFGVIFVLVGILGFIPGANDHAHSDMPAMAVDSFYGRLLGLFPVNLMHNIVHIAVGLWGLFSSGSVSASRFFGRGLAIIYGLLTILGLIPATFTLFGLAPIFGHDVWLHALSALVAGYFGFIARDDSGNVRAV
jgi:hypothetical protein